MFYQLRLSINQLYKNVTRTSNFYTKSSQQNSIISARRFHESSCKIITVKKIRESNLAYADLFADYKSVQSNSNKFPTQIKSELHSNLESLPSWRCNKLTENSDKKRCKTCQLTHKFPFFESPPEKYRLSYLRELPESSNGEVETELFDSQHILDPSYKIKVSQDLFDEIERQMQTNKFGHDTSGPITWSIIF